MKLVQLFSSEKKLFLIVTLLWIIARIFAVVTFDKLNRTYFHEMVYYHYSLAHSAWNGHWLAYDPVKRHNAIVLSEEKYNRNLSLKEFLEVPGSGVFSQFTAKDLPTFGYIIYFTSKWFGNELREDITFGIQLCTEYLGLLLFLCSIYLIFGRRITFISGILYTVGFPFLWPVTGQLMRDPFSILVYSCLCLSFSIALLKSYERKIYWRYILFFLTLGSVLLWIRPSPLFAFYMATPLLLLIKSIPMKRRIGVAALFTIIPYLIFSIPFKSYTKHFYGVSDVKIHGWGLWVGLGNVKNNPYGFRYSDKDFLEWGFRTSGDTTLVLGDPRLNQLGLDYSLQIIKKDPMLYVRGCIERFKLLLKEPLSLDPVWTLEWFSSSGLSVLDYIKTFPVDAIHHIVKRYGKLFFFSGMLSYFFFLIYFCKKNTTQFWALIGINLPLVYHLSQYIFYVSERRHFTGGAWTIILPVALLISGLISYSTKIVRPLKA